MKMNPEKIAIITDSCADLKPEHIGNDPIFVVPLTITCGDRTFQDGVDITAQDVYRLARVEMPKTSLPSPASVYDTLDEIRSLGYEKVLAIMMSSGLSGTFNMVRLAGETCEDLEVYAVDSLSGSLGSGCMVLQTMAYINEGKSWEEIKRMVHKLMRSTYPYFSIDTLEYLKKGGRIGKVTAVAGGMLKLKPILGFTSEGELTSVAKCRGQKQVQAKLLEILSDALSGHKRYNLCAARGGAEDTYPAFREALLMAFPDYENFFEAELDATLAVYTGPGMLGACVQILDDL
jgi:DegV family protein with EDD domain